jgi:hypothetical protein
VLPQPTISKSAKEKSGLSVKIARIIGSNGYVGYRYIF